MGMFGDMQMLETIDAGGAPPAILYVAAESEAVAGLSAFLERRGYRVARALTGAAAEGLLTDARPDLVLVDVALPDADALVLAADLKAMAAVPLVVHAGRLTRRRSDPVIALRLGADDFVAGAGPDELEARLARLLRHAPCPAPATPVLMGGVQQIGTLAIDPARLEVRLGDRPVRLTASEYRLLVALADRPGEVLSREELAERLWGSPDAGSRAIDVHVVRLRAKLAEGPVAAPQIVAVRGFGYKLVADDALAPAV